MITLNRTEAIISGSINGTPFSCTYSAEKYDKMKELYDLSKSVKTMAELQSIIEAFTELTSENYKEVVECKTPYLFVNNFSGKYFLKYNNVVSSFPMPKIFVNKILESVDKGLDFMPIIKCWVRFLRNPNLTVSKAENFAKYVAATYVDNDKIESLMKTQGLSHEMAKTLATTTQVSITEEGLIVGYKVSREVDKKFVLDAEGNKIEVDRYAKTIDEDTGLVTYNTPTYVEQRLFLPAVQGISGDAFHCDGIDTDGVPYTKVGHHIRVGAVHYLPDWSFVNTNDNTSCVKGLHVGGLTYIKGYQTKDTVTHNVLIDPMDIGAICDINGGGDGAIRVLRYFVHSSFGGVNKNLYHSSTYAKLTDSLFLKMLEEAVEKTKENSTFIQSQLAELQALA